MNAVNLYENNIPNPPTLKLVLDLSNWKGVESSYKPSVLFVGRRQIVQTQTAVSDQALHYLLAEYPIKMLLK